MEVTHILCKFNTEANTLTKMGSECSPIPVGVFMEALYKPSIVIAAEHPLTAPDVASIKTDWILDFLEFLIRDILLTDPGKAEWLQCQAKNYSVIDGSLYRKSASGILMKCVSLEEGRSLLQDIHSGMCCSHAGYKSMVGKAFRQGFYWPIAVSDAQQIVRTCENCQFYARQIHKPAQELQTIPIS